MATTILSPNKYAGRNKAVRLIVIHTMEVDENDPNVAESVARTFANPARQASAHWCVDTDSEVRCVADEDTAWAAPGGNSDGLQIELAGRAGQTAGDWQDAASQAILNRAAPLVAAWAVKYGIPLRHLSVAETAAGAKGFVGHVDVSQAFHQSDHWDPGASFPWDQFLAKVAACMGQPVPASNPVAPAAAPVGSVTVNRDVKQIQALVGAGQDGIYGPDTTAKVKAWQSAHGLTPDGVWGPLSDAKGFPPAPAPAPSSGPTLQVGSKGAEVVKLQQTLNRNYPAYSKLAEDGAFGPATKAVVVEFQRRAGLVQDGIVGPKTRAALGI